MKRKRFVQETGERCKCGNCRAGCPAIIVLIKNEQEREHELK